MSISKRDDFWESITSDSDGHVQWPTSPSELATIARDVFGARIVHAMDNVIEDEVGLLDGTRPKPGDHEFQEQARIAATFASMSEEQKAAVRHVLKRGCRGVLYWVLANLDQFPGGTVDILVRPTDDKGNPLPVSVVNEDELHHHFFSWIERFSDQVSP